MPDPKRRTPKSMLDAPMDIHAPAPRLPQGDPNDNQIERFISGLVNGPMTPQTPGVRNELPEALGAIGSLATMLPVGKLLAAFRAEKTGGQATNLGDQMLRSHVMPTPAMEAEFAPITAGQRPPLEPAELQKMLDLIKNTSQGQGGPKLPRKPVGK